MKITKKEFNRVVSQSIKEAAREPVDFTSLERRFGHLTPVLKEALKKGANPPDSPPSSDSSPSGVPSGPQDWRPPSKSPATAEAKLEK